MGIRLLAFCVSDFDLPEISLKSIVDNRLRRRSQGQTVNCRPLSASLDRRGGFSALHDSRHRALLSPISVLAPIVVLLLSCAVPACHAQDKAIPEAPHQDAKAPQSQRPATQPAYAVAQLLPCAVQPGVTIPAAYVDGMEVRIAHALEGSKRFTQVNQSSNISAAPSASTLQIGCTVIKFAPGNRAVRAYIPGAGATKITVHVVFSDAQRGKVLLEQDVKGLVWYGGAINGFGNPNNAQNDVAKDIENIVKKHF